MRSPFKFLDAYTIKDRECFFGREQETEALYEMIFRTPLILLFGLSGTGKTSLVQCGLAACFDGPEWYPFYIRRKENINESLRSALSEALEEPPNGAGLTEMVSELFEEYLSPVYLIFDQFEELFILGALEEQEQFARDIKGLLDAELPCKIIFVMREEYLGRLYHFEKVVPTLFDFRLRVEPMSNAKVKEVLSASFEEFNIDLEPPADERLEEIIKNLSGEKALIQLPYLQVYLDMMWREDYERTYADNGSTNQPASEFPALTFTQKEIEDFGPIEKVLEKFLQQQQVELEEELEAVFLNLPEEAVRRVLDVFVTEEGTRRPVRFERSEGGEILLQDEAAKLIPEIPQAAVTACLESLEQRRLVRFGDEAIELAHDALAALIDRERSDKQRRVNQLQSRIVLAEKDFEKTGEYLGVGVLGQVEELWEDLRPRLEEKHRIFIRESKKKQEEELETERRKRRRANLLATAALVAALGAIVLFFWALDKQVEARSQQQRAEEQEQLALNLANSVSVKAQETESALEAVTAARENLQEALSEAERERARAQREEQRARTASLNLFNNLLEDVQNDILTLEYARAREKLVGVVDDPVDSKTLGRALMEIAYVDFQIGKLELALGLSDTIARLYGRPFQPAVIADRSALDTLFKHWDPARYAELEARYYPEMVLASGGEFEMGCLEERDQDCQGDETPHLVHLDTFRIAKTETTVWQYYLFTQATGRDFPGVPSWGRYGDHPVVGVSWFDAVIYANWVSQQLGYKSVYQLSGNPLDPNDSDGQEIEWHRVPDWSAKGFRLPTEAEWEYAGRGGRQSKNYPFAGSDQLDGVAWHGGNSENSTHPVKTKKENELGLFDMSGNVWEWCWDWYGNYSTEPIKNPTGSEKGVYRVSRGGAWDLIFGGNCRLSFRGRITPDQLNPYIGFRLSQNFTP